MKAINFKIQIFPSLVTIIYCLLAILGCSKDKKQSQKTADLDNGIPSSSSVIFDTVKTKRNRLQKPEMLQGIVYVSNAHFQPHLALESENGKVYMIIGDKQIELNNFQHKKVIVWGHVHETRAIEGIRDSVEVLRYEVIRGEGG